MPSFEKRDYEKCTIYDRLLKHCCDVISGHIYCPGTYSTQEERQCKYIRNIGTSLRNHSCRGKTISTTYFEYVLVALGIKHSNCKSHIFIFDLPPSTIVFQLFHKKSRFKKNGIAHKVCVLISSTTFV